MAENKHDIMKLAMLSTDGGEALKYGNPENMKFHAKCFFDFTDQEALNIANKLLEKKNYAFNSQNCKIERGTFKDQPKNEILNKVTISNSNDPHSKTRLCVTLLPFYGNWKVDKVHYQDDGKLRALIAIEMVKKYGDVFKYAYAKHWVEEYQNDYKNTIDLMANSTHLKIRLSAIGKKADPDAMSQIIMGHYSYDMLKDMEKDEMSHITRQLFE